MVDTRSQTEAVRALAVDKVVRYRGAVVRLPMHLVGAGQRAIRAWLREEVPRSVGRPAVARETERLTLTLSAAQVARVDASRRDGETRADVVRRWIDAAGMAAALVEEER